MITLTNDNPTIGANAFVFTKASGVRIRKFDPGHPTVREVVDPIPGAHGTQDYTQFFGSRVLTLEFQIYPPWADQTVTRRQIIDNLRSLCNPVLRPYLVEEMNGEEARRIMLRPDTMTMPYELPHTNAVQMSFIAPTGLWESAIETMVSLPAAGVEAPGLGRTYDRTYPVSYPAKEPSGTGYVTNTGNINAYPTLRIRGPFTALTVGNITTGKDLELPYYGISAGEWLDIDLKNHTIYENGNPSTTKYDEVDWEMSDWWDLVPGVNLLKFTPAGYTGDTALEVTFRHAWI